MSLVTEDKLEQICIEWFQDTGWDYRNGPDISPNGKRPEREDYHQVVLTNQLQEAMERINPHIPPEKLEEAAKRLCNPDPGALAKKNQSRYSHLINGIDVEWSEGDTNKQDHAYPIDFGNPHNNRFLVVNQFTVQGEKKLRRPDLVIFINGLPIVVIELKDPSDENADIWSAYNQLQTYKQDIPDLFHFNLALVISDGMLARVGSLTASQERFQPWRAIKNEKDKPLLEFELENVVQGFFDRELLLDYLRYFVLFEQKGNSVIKKIAGYHQFHAVQQAVKATLLASNTSELSSYRSQENTTVDSFIHGEKSSDLNEVAESSISYNQGASLSSMSTVGGVTTSEQVGSKKAGVVWHTQGSGKSISMCCYAGMLLQQTAMKNPTLVIVTDRNDLDGQLFDTFHQSKELLKQTPVQVEGREGLRSELLQRQAGGIIFTTIQKFSLLDNEDRHPELSGRSNIVVISDEAHRSQYGLKAKLKTTGKQKGKYVFGYAKHLRDALPNATFIGFTGTPIALTDKDTQAVFGNYVSIYDIQDSVLDGATVPIYYESRLAKLDINRKEIDDINDQVEDVIEDEEDTAKREKTKSVWATLEKLVGTEPRLQEVAKDLVTHFETRNESMEGKGMIVCMSREICVRLYNKIIELRPDWHNEDPEKGAIKVVMTGSASDSELLRPHIHSRKVKKRLEGRFKDPDDPFKLVIVRDMWLTGFDAPCCHTMYVDKTMEGHNLMQAIARVNRVFKDKEGGLVVDYIGIANRLKEAMRTYTDSNGKGQATHQTEEAFSILQEKIAIVRGLFHGFDYSDFETESLLLLTPAANHLLNEKKVPDGKQRFLNTMASLSKAHSLCSTMDEVLPLKKEIAFFDAIKAVILKHTNVDKKRSEEAKHTALKQILDNAIVSEGVDDIFTLAGLNKPNIGLLSEEFLHDVRNTPHKNLAVELLAKLIRDDIKTRMKTDVVNEKKFTDRLLDTLKLYHNRNIEAAQVIEELIQMAKDMEEDANKAEALGLNPDELAFYHALANNESAVRELGDDTLKEIAIEITEKLRRSTTVDWSIRESVRAKLRNLVRRALRRWKYPPDKAKEAVELVLKQAEALSGEWSSE